MVVLGRYYNRGGVTSNWEDNEELTDHTGKKYVVFKMYNINYEEFAKDVENYLK